MYAHVLIEHGDQKYKPGDPLPDSLPGLHELVEHGSAGVQKPTQTVEVDTDGRVVGAGNEIARFDGDWSDKQIAREEPHTQGAFLGTHRNEAEHRQQEPEHYDDGTASD